ncbi:MAG: SMP-30/gluconolactonase/LRE family protein [Halioglobus sp.]
MQRETIADGLFFGEGPRWHDGRLWFSDFYQHAVLSVGAHGDVRIEHQFSEQTSGLGWLPDGRLVVVGMNSMTLLRQEESGFVVHADLSEHARHLCNDMVIDADGRAYVGNFGFDLDEHIRSRGPEVVMKDHPKADLICVEPDGRVHVAAPDLSFPNGAVITPDGNTLIIAETLGMCLTAFDRAEDGSLSNRREWAPVGGRAPDGICLDADGNVWVADALSTECVLFEEGGNVMATAQASQNCFACMLGGEDGNDLFMMTAPSSDKSKASKSPGAKIERVKAPAPRAGWP